MAPHRLKARAEESAVGCRSHMALGVSRFNPLHAVTLRQRVIAMTRNPALTVATIAPLVLACAVSGVARRVPPPTPALPHVAVASVAAVAVAARCPSVTGLVA